MLAVSGSRPGSPPKRRCATAPVGGADSASSATAASVQGRRGAESLDTDVRTAGPEHSRCVQKRAFPDLILSGILHEDRKQYRRTPILQTKPSGAIGGYMTVGT